MELELNRLSYEDIKIGSAFSFERFIDEKLVKSFAEVSGDYNPLHLDEVYAKSTEFGGRIAHGMLLASLFSALVGMLCPGARCLYLSQELNFRKPLRLNTRVTVEGKVAAKSDAARLIDINTAIKDGSGAVVVDGLARVKVRA